MPQNSRSVLTHSSRGYRRLRSRSAGPAPPEIFRVLIPAFLFLASGAFLAVFGIPCFIDKSLQFLILARLASLLLCPHSTPTPGFSGHQSFSIKGLLYPAKTVLTDYICFGPRLQRSHSEVLEGQDSNISFAGTQFNPQCLPTIIAALNCQSKLLKI